MVLPVLGAIAGGLIAARASSKAASAQTAAANEATDAQVEIADKQIALARETQDTINQNLAPYRAAGENALRIQNHNISQGFQYDAAPGMSVVDGQFQYQTPTMEEFQEQPGYQFQLEQGQRAIDGSAAAQGNLFSGATLKAQQQFGQGLADQSYQSFLDDYRTQQANVANDYRAQEANYNSLVNNAAASGQNAAAQANNAATNAQQFTSNALANSGSAIAQGAYNVGNASAAGTIGVANALNTGISNGIGAYQYMQNTAYPSIGSTTSFTGLY